MPQQQKQVKKKLSVKISILVANCQFISMCFKILRSFEAKKDKNIRISGMKIKRILSRYDQSLKNFIFNRF